MNRRIFCIAAISLAMCNVAQAANKRFKFRIKTKDKSIIGLSIQATDVEAAKVKVLARYPGAMILSVKED